MLRYVLFTLCVLVTTGCNPTNSVLPSKVDRINQAFPLGDELEVAKNSLFKQLEEQGNTRKKLAQQYGSLIEVRALTCTSAHSIEFFDSASEIRTKVADRDCFRKQDQLLMSWIGQQRLAITFNMESLAPYSALNGQSIVSAQSNPTSSIVSSRASNVLVLKGTSQNYSAVQIPEGSLIANFPIPEQAHRPESLSPNGRVLAIPISNRSLKFIDVQTGNTIWETGNYSNVIAWMDDVGAIVLSDANGSASFMLDTHSGKISPYPSANLRSTWSVALPGKRGDYLIGSQNAVSLAEHMRKADGGIATTQTKEWRLKSQGVTSTTPMLMEQGKKLVYLSGRDLSWLKLDTGEQGTWELSGINANGFSKIDESNVLFFSVGTDRISTAPQLLNIEQQTIAAVQNIEPSSGLLLPLTERSGYVIRNSSAVTVGGSVTAATPQALDKVLGAVQLELQLARLNAQTAMASNVAGGIAGTNFTGAATKPLLTNIPSNARVSAIGVYEAASGQSKSGVAHSMGTIRVNVSPVGPPLVLVLSSYEPVRWVVASNGRQIVSVLLNSYHESNVIGVDSGSIVRIGTSYAYNLESSEYVQMKQHIARYVSNPVHLFQGKYSGSEFSVPGN